MIRLAVIAVMFGLWLVPRPMAMPIVAEAMPVASQPADTREAWAVDLLGRLGNTRPSPSTVAFVVAWTVAEDGCWTDCAHSSARERWNWLNTTQTGYNEVAIIDGDGVRAYASYEDGMAATLKTLSYGYYTEIVAGLQTNDPERAYNALIASPWAGSRYGGGAAFGQGWRTR